MTHPVLPAEQGGSLTLQPIGVVHSSFRERVQAPRQPGAAQGSEGRIVLYPGSNFEHALLGLDSFHHIWVLFWFHRNRGWRPKVSPPRSVEKQGVFATRAPYRPNPLGLSAVELVRIEGLTLHIRNLDILDGTPVLDIKPYVVYADALPDSGVGWLGQTPVKDPGPQYTLQYAEPARAALEYLRNVWQLDLETRIQQVLELGPASHPYRRIRRSGDQGVIAIQEFRVDFRSLPSNQIEVQRIRTGYKPRQLYGEHGEGLILHRALYEGVYLKPEV